MLPASPQRARRERASRRAKRYSLDVKKFMNVSTKPLPTTLASSTHTSQDSVACLHDAEAAFANSPSHSKRFPLYAMRLEDLKETVSTRTLEPMQAQLKRGRIHKWDASMGKLLFISHQWLDWDHPDPNLHQLREFIKYFSNLTTPSMKFCEACDLQPGWTGETNIVGLEDLAEHIGSLWIWYDFICVPQLHCVPQSDHAARRECENNFGRAVLSIPSYVEQSSYFLVLAPPQIHCRTGSVVDYQAWGQRGWCRLELSCRILAQHSGPVMVLSSSTKVSIMRATDYYLRLLAVGRGEYACCSRNHVIDGRVIRCDKHFATQVLSDALSVKLHDLIERKNFEGYRFWMSCRAAMFENLPSFHMSTSLIPENSVRSMRQKLSLAADPEPEAGFTLMRYAVMSDNLVVVRALLEKGEVVDLSQPLVKDDKVSMRSRGSTLVHEAARCFDGGAQSLVQKYGSAETMLELLHRFGADLNERDAIGCTVLHYAARAGRARNILYVLRALSTQLSDSGSAGSSCRDVSSSGECSPCSVDNCEEQRQRAVDVEAEDIFGNRALHFAAMHTLETAVFDALIEVGGAQVDAQNKLGSSPLHLAAVYGNRIGAQALLRHASALGCDCVNLPKTVVSAEGALFTLTAEMLYRIGKRTPMVVMLGQDSGGTPLSNAARYGHRAICDLLISAGADSTCRCASGWTPAEQAFNSGHRELAGHLDPTLQCRNEATDFIQCSDWPNVLRRIRETFQNHLSAEMQDQLLRDCHSLCLSGRKAPCKDSALSLVDMADEALMHLAPSESSVERSSTSSGGSGQRDSTRLRQLDVVLDEIAR